MPEKREAISYDRFSDPKQRFGDSTGRQSREFIAFCERHKLKPAAEHYSDHGRSGFKGTHRSKGDLGRFESLVDEGLIPAGRVLVIEAWDRLSRERPDRVTKFVSKILGAGIDIGIAKLDDVFTDEDMGGHKWHTFSAFVYLAHAESKQKSERVKASWKTRRARARTEKRPTTTCGPAWLKFQGGKFVEVPDRADVVRRIFHLAASGYGVTRIVKTLTDEGVSPFGESIVREGRTRSRYSGVWTRPYVRKILNDRRALGEYQPRDGKGNAEGAPVRDYYPIVVTEREFYLARAGADSRRIGRRGPRLRKYINVFQGLLRNADDGEGFHLQTKVTPHGPKLILVSDRGAAGRGKSVTFHYEPFETEILKNLREVDAADLTPAHKGTSSLDVLNAEAEHVAEEIRKVKEAIRRRFSDHLDEILSGHEANAARLREEIDLETAKAASPPAADWKAFRSLADAIADAKDKDDVRLKIRTLLRRRVSEIWVEVITIGSIRYCGVGVFFVDNPSLRRDYLIRHQTAGKNRPEGVKSIALVGGEASRGKFDEETLLDLFRHLDAE